jgi:hypothetical protein
MLANIKNVREAINLAHWYQRAARDPRFAINNPKPQVSKEADIFDRDENFMPRIQPGSVRKFNPATGTFE